MLFTSKNIKSKLFFSSKVSTFQTKPQERQLLQAVSICHDLLIPIWNHYGNTKFKRAYSLYIFSFLVTHLSNQKYDICIRQPKSTSSTTHICYIACTSVAGISAANAAATAQVGSRIYITPTLNTNFYRNT